MASGVVDCGYAAFRTGRLGAQCSPDDSIDCQTVCASRGVGGCGETACAEEHLGHAACQPCSADGSVGGLRRRIDSPCAESAVRL